MITITIYQNCGRVAGFRCSGHSGYAEAGNDIVCAGVSALVINTVNSIETLTSATFRLHTEAESGLIDFRFDQDRETGSGRIDFRFDREAEHDSALLVGSMVLGLQGIQRDYGDEYLVLDFREV